MPEQKIGLKSAKRFGTRYGPTNKIKLAVIEEEQRKFHTCPSCGKVKVGWLSFGIFECRKCGHKFTGKAYSVTKSLTFSKKQAAERTPAEIEASQKIAAEARKQELAEEEA
jgi:large subunit ribosomal protein L37Ae